MPLSTVRSACPYDCPDCCGLLVDTDGERVLAVRGDPEHGYSQGTLCGKLNGYERTVHAPGRILTPLLRDGEKGSGRFRPATWDEAVAAIASRWKEIVAAHGGEAILPYSYAGTMGLVQRNAGEAFFHRLGASRLDRTICTPAQNAGWDLVMGATPGPDPDEARESDMVVLWGVNAVATNVHFLARVHEARRRGARIWLVDTYRTPTAKLADEVVLVRPGSDGALALSMLHVLDAEGLTDSAFLGREVQGWEALRREVLPEHPPERGAALTGVPAERIRALARAYGRARAPFIRLGGGNSRYGNGAMTTRLLVCLPAAVGAWRKRGGGLLASTGTGQAFDLAPFTRPDLQPGPTRLVNMNRLGHALNELTGPRVMSLYVHTSNPAAVAPDQNAVLRGLARPDLFTVVHERFSTDTVRWADVVLPAPTMLETADLYRSYGQFFLQRTRPAIRPLGQALSNWDTFRLLAAAMGFDEPLFQQTADQVIDGLLAAPSPWREGIDRAALDEGRAVRLREPRDRWLTPSGRIEIENPRAAIPLPRWVPTHEEQGTLPLRLQTAPSVETLNSSFGEREELVRRRGPMALQVAPGEAAARGLADGQRVVAWNGLGEVELMLRVTDAVPPGVAVAEGVVWLDHAPGPRSINALTSQRLTDEGAGSTFYDNRIDVRAAPTTG
ncbi:MAG: molybdopterin oxidoreductase family protein [Deltaproteobacteria bacterium]|nr:molybdopterin oxidoreductase family protein [Deltaproteobacteria bacterium]